MRRALQFCRGLLLAAATLCAACSTLPPGSHYPKQPSVALEDPGTTQLGRQFLRARPAEPGQSAFRIIPAGVDGFVLRMQMIRAAERTLDLQYFIFRGDETGRLLTEELSQAARRGVRVRVLVDDGDTLAGDEQVLALGSRANIEVRVFNPFTYRGHNKLLRHLDFAAHFYRLDYRMHNKLLVADNSAALIGGRNIGNQYFQLDSDSQFADDDVFSAGPIANQLSSTFDEFWNSSLAIPVNALGQPATRSPVPVKPASGSGIDYLARVATGLPYADLISGKLPLTWANAEIYCDSPYKKDIVQGRATGALMAPRVLEHMAAARGELLMITPYFTPSDSQLAVLKQLRSKDARVRILSNSLESAPDPAAHSGYGKVRVGLLEEGVELYEIRSRLDDVTGSGQTKTVSRFGNYSLHAKLYVFDREQMFIGSMNFDQRSLRINTEIGVLIHSSVLARQTAERFDHMVSPGEAYTLALHASGPMHAPQLVWQTERDHQREELTVEPSRSWLQRVKVRWLSLLPLDREL